MIEKNHILEILKQTVVAVKSENILLLQELSNKTIHSASLYQDPDSIAMAVNIYALSKLFENEKFRYYKYWPIFIKKTLISLARAHGLLERGKLHSFRKEIISLRKNVNMFGHLKDYIKEVFLKASLNKASRIYEHGISRAETASLLGISQWEIASYSAVPAIIDVDLSLTKSMKERVKLAEDLFS